MSVLINGYFDLKGFVKSSADTEFPFNIELSSRLSFHRRQLEEKLSSSSTSSSSLISFIPNTLSLFGVTSSESIQPSTTMPPDDNTDIHIASRDNILKVHDIELNLPAFSDLSTNTFIRDRFDRLFYHDCCSSILLRLVIYLLVYIRL